MFDIGWSEMALIAVVAVVVIGPKELPTVLRTAGQWIRKARALASEFQRGLDDMVRESELKDIKSQVEKTASIGDLQRDLEKSIDPTGDLAKGLELPPPDFKPEGDSQAPSAESAPANEPRPHG